MGWITIRQLALICLWAFFFLSLFFLCLLLRVSVLFVRLLAYGVCPLLLISSALISHFTAAEGTQNVCCCSARTYFGISLGRQVSPTMLMRSKFESSHLPFKWEKCTHTHIYTHTLCESTPSPSLQNRKPHTPTHPPPNTRKQESPQKKKKKKKKTAQTETFCYHPSTITSSSHLSIHRTGPSVSHHPSFPFLVPSLHSSLPPSASHYLLLLSLLSSRSSTSLVLPNFPCPRCFLFLFFLFIPPTSSLSFRVLIPSFTSTPLSPPNFHHSPSHHSLPLTLSVRSLSSSVACLRAFVLRTLLSHRSFFTLTLPSASMTHLSFIRYPSSPSPPLSWYPWTSCQCVWPFFFLTYSLSPDSFSRQQCGQQQKKHYKFFTWT